VRIVAFWTSNWYIVLHEDLSPFGRYLFCGKNIVPKGMAGPQFSFKFTKRKKPNGGFLFWKEKAKFQPQLAESHKSQSGLSIGYRPIEVPVFSNSRHNHQVRDNQRWRDILVNWFSFFPNVLPLEIIAKRKQLVLLFTRTESADTNEINKAKSFSNMTMNFCLLLKDTQNYLHHRYSYI
jgi:hypothetical protein